MTRRDNELYSDRWTLGYDHGALTATTTVKLYKVPAGRTLRLDRATYINPTGLAADNTNAFKGEIKNSTTLVASLFNTDGNDDPAGAALAADTFVEGTLAASADCVFAAGEIVSVVFTEDGDATLPAGHLVLEGRLF